MEFKVLGPLEVRRDGRVVAIGGGKPRAVLAVLLLHANEPVSADRLSAALWGDEAPPGAVRTAQVHVSRLRRALGDAQRVTTTPAGYRLQVAPGELDAEQFERLVESGRRALADGRADEAGRRLREALALWRGPALADLAFEPFAAAETERLEEQRLAALEQRIEADLAAARHAELVAELRRLISKHPLRERLHGQLMLALYRSGRQAEALDAYREARAMLVERLGIEPGTQLRDLQQAILTQRPGLAVGPESPGRRHVRIPAPATATLGRGPDLARVRALLADPSVRLVTVVGPPGVGKTRLATEVARVVAPGMRDGGVFVSLAGLQAAEHVASTVARELGVTLLSSESADEALERALAARELLLVLDNFEHVLEAASLVAGLLAAAPDVTVLATSREPLRVRAERVFALEPLALPADPDPPSVEQSGPAVELFIATSRARSPSFRVGPGDLPVAVALCRRLDGLPLAIELAAGRTGLLSMSELLARLSHDPVALGDGPRDAVSRQRTLAATLEWSFALLNAVERRAFAGLGAFAGGCTLDAAQAVTDAPLEVLEALVDKNLVLVDDRHRRLRMLETVREFARARLADSDIAAAVHRRHCDHYLAFAERVRQEFERSSSAALLAELDRELDNVRAALRWSIEQAPVPALRLVTALKHYWSFRALHSEAVRNLESALANAGDHAPAGVRAAALAAYAVMLDGTAMNARAEAAARESVRIYDALGDASGRARSTSALAFAYLRAHRDGEAFAYAHEAARRALECGDEQAYLWALQTIAMSAPTLREALVAGERAAAAQRAADNHHELARLRTSLAYAALGHGDHAVAEGLALDALDAAEADGDPYLIALTLGNAGLAALLRDDAERAGAALVRELRLAQELGVGSLIFEALSGLAAVAAAYGRDRVAATLSGAADATGERHEPRIARQLEERFFAPARARLTEEAWQAAHSAGTTLDREAAMDAAQQAIDRRARVAGR